MPVIEGTTSVKTLEAEYDFAVDGGAVGTFTMRSAPGGSLGAANTLPIGAEILSGYIDVLTACLSGTGTIAINAESAGDVLAATAQAGLTLGRKSIIPAGTGATAIKTTAARNLGLTIATGAFTAGKFRVVLLWR
jgi:hypothetical protein